MPYKQHPLDELAARVHEANTKWWIDLETDQPKERNVGEMLMLCVSELAEALEGHRKGLQDDKLVQYRMLDVELADCLIRILDLCAGLNINIGEVFESKMDFNRTREDHKIENRKKEGGKKY